MFLFLAGMACGTFLVAACFFFRFWHSSRDWFFAVCGLFFVLLAVNHAAFVLVETPREDQGWIYLFRLAGFLFLLAAIVIKNMPSRSN